jgi:hypothetical protein
MAGELHVNGIKLRTHPDQADRVPEGTPRPGNVGLDLHDDGINQSQVDRAAFLIVAIIGIYLVSID